MVEDCNAHDHSASKEADRIFVILREVAAGSELCQDDETCRCNTGERPTFFLAPVLSTGQT